MCHQDTRSDTTGASYGVGAANLSSAPEFTIVFCWSSCCSLCPHICLHVLSSCCDVYYDVQFVLTPGALFYLCYWYILFAFLSVL